MEISLSFKLEVRYSFLCMYKNMWVILTFLLVHLTGPTNLKGVFQGDPDQSLKKTAMIRGQEGSCLRKYSSF